MPLVSSKEILQDAYDHHYAIGAFAGHNLEMIKAIVSAAEELDSPVIIQTTPGTINYLGIGFAVNMVKEAAEQVRIPVSLHLDHGDSFRCVNQCLRNGYTSIMVDGSSLGYEENITLTKKVVEVCHDVGVPVEAELGTIGGVEDGLDVDRADVQFTDPDIAEEFVIRTGIDFLAPAFGTAHGIYKLEPKLDFSRLKAISDLVRLPLVMHGASGLSKEHLQKAVQLGVSKVNFSTELKKSFVQELRNYLSYHSGEEDPRKYFVSARESVKRIVKNKISTLQSSPQSVV